MRRNNDYLTGTELDQPEQEAHLFELQSLARDLVLGSTNLQLFNRHSERRSILMHRHIIPSITAVNQEVEERYPIDTAVMWHIEPTYIRPADANRRPGDEFEIPHSVFIGGIAVSQNITPLPGDVETVIYFLGAEMQFMSGSKDSYRG